MRMNARQQAIQTIAAEQPVRETGDVERKPITEIFGQDVFTLAVMRDALPKVVFEALLHTIEEDVPLDREHADTIATAMKAWAIRHGATHYTHWFQPMTGLTAEKHDAFITYTAEGHAITQFSGASLIRGEPDASSFPSGGIRATFEARGYTAWDPTSPAFLRGSPHGKTLCIPTAFCSFNGHALDKKTPLLRSLDALGKQAVRLLGLLGDTGVTHVTSTVGPEQEYFVVDRRLYSLRPDLVAAGRTLFGAKPPKGQEMEDHYFGSIRSRILAFMLDAEAECYKLGIPIKTRHNEVAPAQFEVAPIFERANVAADHNMLVMEIFRTVAERHCLQVLLHEKPFAGVNGSGKHNNWSLMDNRGNNLLEPGRSPEKNARFIVLLSAVLRGVHRWAKVLRTGVGGAGNDHRLGANEAPPAIISVFLGDALSGVVRDLVEGRRGPDRSAVTLNVGAQALPSLPRDASDRNRTSPFAFTGNRFEFRAVGASQSISRPMTYLHTIVADSFDAMATSIEARLAAGETLNDAVMRVVRETLAESEKIVFDGDNYSPEWQAEARRRGLPNLRDTVESEAVLREPEVIDLFARHGVFTPEEISARFNVNLEQYVKTLHIEALLKSTLGKESILPAALRYQRDLADTVLRCREAVGDADVSGPETVLRRVCELTSRLQEAIVALDTVRAEADSNSKDLVAQATFYRDKVIPAMGHVRSIADALEEEVADDYWPLPKYREMLFVY